MAWQPPPTILHIRPAQSGRTRSEENAGSRCAAAASLVWRPDQISLLTWRQDASVTRPTTKECSEPRSTLLQGSVPVIPNVTSCCLDYSMFRHFAQLV